MPTFDFEDGLIPSEFRNSDERPWVDTTVTANGGTHSMKAGAVSNSEMSSIFIFANFAAGDFDCDYRVSSESGFDRGYIIVDGVQIVNASGNGSWTAMPTQTFSAGVHFIQFVYTKDDGVSSNDDTFYIDNVVLPAITDISDLVEDFPGGAVPSRDEWVNDGTNPWQSSTGTPADIHGLKSKTSLANNGTSTLTYNSPTGSPAGVVFMAGFADSEQGFDFFKLLIDDVEVYSDSGEFFNEEEIRTPLGYFSTVTSGTHKYEFEYSKDGSALGGLDSGFLNLFSEPGYDLSATGSETPQAVVAVGLGSADIDTSIIFAQALSADGFGIALHKKIISKSLFSDGLGISLHQKTISKSMIASGSSVAGQQKNISKKILTSATGNADVSKSIVHEQLVAATAVGITVLNTVFIAVVGLPSFLVRKILRPILRNILRLILRDNEKE